MKRYKLDEKACNITVLAGSGYTQVQIAKELNMTESAVSQRINSLQRYHYLVKNKSGVINTFGLEPLGIALVIERARRGINTLNNTDSKFYEPLVRIHNIEAKYDVLTSISPSEPLLILSTAKIEFQPVGLRNHSSGMFVHKKYTVMLTPDSLIIYGQDVIGKYAEIDTLWLTALDTIDSVALDLEARLGIRLKGIKDTLIKHLIKLHVALIDNMLAEIINDKNSDVYGDDSKNC